MATEKVIQSNQDFITVDKKIEVRRTRAHGVMPIVVLDPTYPNEGLRIYNSTGTLIFEFDVHNGLLEFWGTDGNHNPVQTGSINTGVNGGGATLHLNNHNGQNTIWLTGEDGTIHGSNADLAENFLCSQPYNTAPDEGYGVVTDPIQPGDVLVISEDGTLVKCENEYDTRVAGVVSGAKDFKPAIILDEFDLQAGEGNPGRANFPLALAGKVFCKVTGEVRAGDLLVTSSQKGVAMRADPRAGGRVIGAILGKALASAPATRRPVLIPILVMLG